MSWGRGKHFPPQGVLMSPQPCPEPSESSGTSARAIEGPGLFGAFYQPETRNKLKHEPCLKQVFCLVCHPKKERGIKKRVRAILKSSNKRADTSAALAVSLLLSHKPTAPLALRSNPAVLFCLVCLFCLDWKNPVSCSLKTVAGKLESETRQIHK